MTASVLVPITITDTMLTSSTVAENEFPEWDSFTEYNIGDKVLSTATHRVYESLIDFNIGIDPTDINNQVGLGGYWLDFSATNRWGMFDTSSSSPTTATTTFTVVLAAGSFTGLYLGGMETNTTSGTVTITIKSAPGGATLYSSGAQPINPSTSSFTVNNLTSSATSETTLVFSTTAGKTISCGMLALGSITNLGQCLYGAKLKPKTYSYIDIDAFGNNTIVKRKSSTDMQCTVSVPIATANAVALAIQNVLATPAVWIASEVGNYSALTVFGLGSGEISYDQPDFAYLSLTVQGLV